jgi:hypothetical protein
MLSAAPSCNQVFSQYESRSFTGAIKSAMGFTKFTRKSYDQLGDHVPSSRDFDYIYRQVDYRRSSESSEYLVDAFVLGEFGNRVQKHLDISMRGKLEKGLEILQFGNLRFISLGKARGQLLSLR